MSERGGFSQNAFGGRPRLDKLDLMSLLGPNDPPEKGLFLSTIVDALNNYLYFGIAARNGTTAHEFWYAHEYFFTVRSYIRDTWKDSITNKITTFDEKLRKKKTTVITFTDTQVMAQCFDIHYQLTDIRIEFAGFLRLLKKIRTDILDENWNQVEEYLLSLEKNAYGEEGSPNPLSSAEKKRILVSPKSPEEVSKLISLRANPVKGEKDENNAKDIGNNICSSSD